VSYSPIIAIDVPLSGQFKAPITEDDLLDFDKVISSRGNKTGLEL
jgi:hypothetical protein